MVQVLDTIQISISNRSVVSFIQILLNDAKLTSLLPGYRWVTMGALFGYSIICKMKMEF